MKGLVALALLSGLITLLDASPASACSCAGGTAFDETVRDTPVVLAGRIAAIGELKNDDDPESIDLDVEWVGKGAVTASTVRVWNTMAGTSCGGVFQGLTIGARVALALTVIGPPEPEALDMQDIVDIHPTPGDLEVRTGCSEGLKLFQTKRDRDRWIARALK